ncbi:MAG: hypothetical protein RLZZ584_1539 [Pseudomonadota bacterium]|jgi:hypothetical protein
MSGLNGAIFVVGLGAALLAGPCGAQAPTDHVGLFKSTSGDVRVWRAGSPATSATPARTGDRILRTDIIRTGPAASAGITFVDGTRLAIDASSDVEIRRYLFEPERRQYEFDLHLRQGAALYTSGKLARLAPDAVKVNTPRATVGVRGTSFLISSEE